MIPNAECVHACFTRLDAKVNPPHLEMESADSFVVSSINSALNQRPTAREDPSHSDVITFINLNHIAQAIPIAMRNVLKSLTKCFHALRKVAPILNTLSKSLLKNIQAIRIIRQENLQVVFILSGF